MSKLEKPKEKQSQNITHNDLYKEATQSLKNIINLLTINPKSTKNMNIYEISYPKFINIEKIKEKLLEIFMALGGIKKIEDIFEYILEEIQKISNKVNKNTYYRNFFNVLQNLEVFITPSLLYFPNTKKDKKKPCDYFFRYIIKSNVLSKNDILAYIIIFDLQISLKDELCLNPEKLKKISDLNKILCLISILNLQIAFPFKTIYNENYKKFQNEKNLSFILFKTYARNMKEIMEIAQFLASNSKNKIEPSVIEKILEDEEISIHLSKEEKIYIIDNLMVDYSTIDINKEIENNEIVNYYKILVNNYKILETKEYCHSSKIKEFLNFIFEKEKITTSFDKTIDILKSIKDEDIIKIIVDDSLVKYLIDSLQNDKLNDILHIIKNYKNFISDLLKKNSFNLNEGLNLIKKLNLSPGEYPEKYDRKAAANFFNYFILSKNYKVLYEYGFENPETFNLMMNICFKKIQEYKKEGNKMEGNIISLDEEEEEKKSSKKSKRKKKNKNSRKTIFSQIDLNKIRKLINEGENNNFLLNEENQNLYEQLFPKNLNDSSKSSKNNTPNDNGHEEKDISEMKINNKTVKIYFIDDSNKLNQYFNRFFKKSDIVGVDSEWNLNWKVNAEPKASILQLSNYEENCSFIIDLIKLDEDKQFSDDFEEKFKGKTYVGYDFNASDLGKFNDTTKKFFDKVEIIDLKNVYQCIYLENSPGLAKLCENFFNINLSKEERLSKWERRPLNESQKKYAALDSLVCIKLYKLFQPKDKN